MSCKVNYNWGVLVTARLKSVRLPRKVLKDLNGMPMIWHVLERMKKVNGKENVVLITSELKDDDALAEYVEGSGYKVFRGDPDDVMKRMFDAAQKNDFENFISCTADNPFVDPVYAKMLMEYHVYQHSDMSKIEGLPFGVFSYAVRTEGLKVAIEDKLDVDTEVWGGYFSENKKLKTSVMYVEKNHHKKPDLRLTVDFKKDFEMVRNLLAAANSAIPNLDEIIQVIEKNPDIKKINAHIQQKQAKSPTIKI